jgi:hypothetical protein
VQEAISPIPKLDSKKYPGPNEYYAQDGAQTPIGDAIHEHANTGFTSTSQVKQQPNTGSKLRDSFEAGR